MDYTKLGNTDIEISKICVGCMSFGKAGIRHDWTLDEEQTAEENSPLTKNTVSFVHQKNQKLFAPGSHFIYLQNHTQKCFCFFPSDFFLPRLPCGSSARFAYRTTSALVKPSTYQYQSAPCITALPPLTYLPRRIHGVLSLSHGISNLEGGFTLRCLQRLSLPELATRLCSWRNNRCTRGQSIPVLSY